MLPARTLRSATAAIPAARAAAAGPARAFCTAADEKPDEVYPAAWQKRAEKELRGKPLSDIEWNTPEVSAPDRRCGRPCADAPVQCGFFKGVSLVSHEPGR